MNQSSNEAPGLNLSSANGEQLPAVNVSKESSVQPAEAAPSAPERASQAAPPALLPIPPAPAADPPQPTQTATQDDVSKTTTSKASKIIEDTDLIEKEWVDKAKLIVERNRDDPYKQSEELTEVRADYMKKVYNKTIKTDK